MSTDQTSLGQFDEPDSPDDPEPDTDDDQPDWASRLSVDDQRRCQHCGAHVTPDMQRTMGDANNEVHRCPSCAPARDLFNGAASDPDYDPETDRMRSTRQGYYPMDGDAL